VAERIVWAWLLTIPASAIVASLMFYGLKLINPSL
jgi:phosphate/sulfate permease